MSARNRRTPRSFLAREVRRTREAKGMNQVQMGKMLFVSDSLVRSWERATRLIQPDHLKKVEALTGAENIRAILTRLTEEFMKQAPSPQAQAIWEKLEEQAHAELAAMEQVQGVLSRLREELLNSGAPLEWFGRWPEIEAQASSLWWLELAVIPGLLQTPEYAHAVLKAAKAFAEYLGATVEEMVDERLQRQQVLVKEGGPTFVALIAESALRNNVGGPAVMHAQLLHLAELAERDHVMVQVIRADSPVCSGFTGPLIIASFDSGNENGHEAAYLDNALSGDVIEDTEEVARARRMFDIFRSEALTNTQSIQFIRKVAAEWQARAEVAETDTLPP